MTAMRGNVVLAVLVALSAVACGAFLADSGDDDRPGAVSEDASVDGSGDDAATSEGGSQGDGGVPLTDGGADSAARPRGATCGAAKCAPDSTCCVANGSFGCTIGDQPCFGNEYACTRNLDCLEGETCCITQSSLTPGSSSSSCSAGGCKSDSQIMCNTADPPADTGCNTGTCRSGGIAATLYGLPDGGPFGLCQ